jgi:hypothetical protein
VVDFVVDNIIQKFFDKADIDISSEWPIVSPEKCYIADIKNQRLNDYLSSRIGVTYSRDIMDIDLDDLIEQKGMILFSKIAGNIYYDRSFDSENIVGHFQANYVNCSRPGLIGANDIMKYSSLIFGQFYRILSESNDEQEKYNVSNNYNFDYLSSGALDFVILMDKLSRLRFKKEDYFNDNYECFQFLHVSFNPEFCKYLDKHNLLHYRLR